MDTDRLLDEVASRGAKRRRRKPKARKASPQVAPTIHVTVNIGHQPGSTRPGRPGQSDVIANNRSRQRRIAPSPG